MRHHTERIAHAERHRRGDEIQRRGQPERKEAPDRRDQRAGHSGPEDARHDVAVRIDGVRALPERARHEEREERAGARGRERERQRLDRDDDQQQRLGQSVGRAEYDDERERRGGDEIVEHHEPRAAVTIEERAGDRRDEQTRKDREEGDEPRKGRRLIALEREQHQGERDHRVRGAREQHAADKPRQAVDLEERAVARPNFGADRHGEYRG